MDEDEIDAWYEEEKEKAMELFLDEITKKKYNVESEEKFKKKLKTLREKYTTMYEKNMKRKKLISAIQKKIDKIKKNLFAVVKR